MANAIRNSQASPTPNPIQDIFVKAKLDFLNELKDKKKWSELQKECTIDDIWAFTEQLQSGQGPEGRLRGLRKIQPYLERLEEYAGVVEVFVQVKPDILALIWGPIKLLLQMSRNITKCFDAILDVMKSIGPALPAFNKFDSLLGANTRIGYVLGLYFKDILDFYLTCLKFFSLKSWQVAFDGFWPIHRSKIDVIIKNMEKHSLLLCNEITMGDILEADEARQRAYAHYEEEREFRDYQNFQSIETYISPPSYDDILDSLRLSRCTGTGTWLQQDATFCRWLDSTDVSTNVVWIRGIPGAGKTYLASTAIDESITKGHCLFAFLSYKQGLQSPLPVLQSLLFQLASQEKNLRSVLCDTIMSGPKDLKRDLKGDTEFTLGTLSKLLKCAGRTFVTIDGLDEVSEATQQALIRLLLGVMTECKETRLLIVSRQGHVLKRSLQDISDVIDINQRNTRCIQSYVNHRATEWLELSGFDREARAEILQLLYPLAATAKGMFLYARLILENIDALQDVEKIREELRVLPGSLDEIYERILRQILKLPAAAQKNARRILSWVACSPQPITRQEMELAVLIEPNTEIIPRVRAELNILQLCGPLVEIRNCNLQFVHFTAKEYILNHEQKPFVDEREAILDVAMTCLNYLCCELFTLSATDEEVQDDLLSGAYRLFRFSQCHWVESIKQLARYYTTKDPPRELADLLQRFLALRSNLKYVRRETESRSRMWRLDFLKEYPEVHDMLSRVLDFKSWQRMSDNCQLSEDDSWVDQDPTTLSDITLQAHRTLESLLCSGDGHVKTCDCLALQKHYGPWLFSCSYTMCWFRRVAFEKRLTRDQHIKHHRRPFKCPIASCEYSIIGFLSQVQCDQHYDLLHSAPVKKDTSVLYENVSPNEIENLLYDLIARDEVDEMKGLASHLMRLEHHKLEKIRGLVAFSGSLEMARVVFDPEYSPTEARRRREIMIKAVEGRNRPVFAWLCENISISKADEFSDHSVNTTLMDSGSTELFDIWQDNLTRFDHQHHSLKWDAIPKKPVPDLEIRLAKFWENNALKDSMKDKWSKALKNVAEYSCSSQLAKTLIQCGADPNFGISRGAHLNTPLLLASRKTTEEAANIMKILLLAGADPYYEKKLQQGQNKGNIEIAAMGAGARGISRWLGMTWDELVAWAKEERKKDATIQSRV
ncbi:hypothetical protein F4818DRAFT_432308 [Hypoxylon cercidicola]|nr:hypothetical protein F4818DRAFT_432308 [Hypoxylon cercidicola]